MFRSSVQVVRILTMFVAALVFTSAAPSARAEVILTFDITGLPGLDPIPQAYGDRVTALMQGNFRYGGDGVFFTPNVVVDYGPGATDARFWPTSYGDLINVAYTVQSQGILEMRLTADPGFLVNLHAFDLAGWLFTDYTIRSVQVLNENGVALFSQSNVLVEGDFVGPRHTSFDFAAALESQSLTIRFDAGNLGGLSQNIGIDNVRFSQRAPDVTPIPEPASLLLAGVGALGLFAYARRRHPRRCVTPETTQE